MQYAKIDADGYFVEDVVFEDASVPDGSVPMLPFVAAPCPPGFCRPRWNGESWIEGATPEEIRAVREAGHAPLSVDARMDQIEAALIEVASLLAGGV